MVAQLVRQDDGSYDYVEVDTRPKQNLNLLSQATTFAEKSLPVSGEFEAYEGANDLMGGLLGQAMDFMKKSPLARAIAIAVALMATLKKMMGDFQKMAMDMLQQTGAIGNEMKKNFMDAAIANQVMGLSISDSVNQIQTLANNFGYTTEEATELSANSLAPTASAAI